MYANVLGTCPLEEPQSPLLVIGHLLKLCFSILFIHVHSRHLAVGIEVNGFQGQFPGIEFLQHHCSQSFEFTGS